MAATISRFEYVNPNQIPVCLGGENHDAFTQNNGPWDDYDLIDGGPEKTADEIGIRRKNDPTMPLIRPKDILRLENISIPGKGVMGTKGAVRIKDDGTVIPNLNATKSESIQNEEIFLEIDDDAEG